MRNQVGSTRVSRLDSLPAVPLLGGKLTFISHLPLVPTLVEYAMEAISHAGSVLAILASDGVVLAAEKKVTSKLLDLGLTKGGEGGEAWAAGGEKIFLLNKCVALLARTAGCNFSLLTSSPIPPRLDSNRHRYRALPWPCLPSAFRSSQQHFDRHRGLHGRRDITHQLCAHGRSEPSAQLQ